MTRSTSLSRGPSALFSRVFGGSAQASAREPGAAAVARAADLDARGLHDRAVDALRDAVAAGSTQAKVVLGGRLIIGRDAPVAPQEGAQLIVEASQAGHPEATTILATLTAAGGLVPQSWPGAFDLLQLGAERGCARAREQLLILAGDRDLVARLRSGEEDAAPWRRLRAGIVFETWVTPPAKEPVCAAPRVRIAQGLAPPDVCDWLIARSRDKLAVALMYDGASRKARWDASRTCSEYAFDILESDVVILLLRARIGALVSLPTVAMEPPQVFHYAAGQEIRPHYDHVYGGEGHGRDGAFTSERVVSLLIYLNDDYEGGELDFPKVGFRHKGRRGDAVFFANVDVDGKRDPLSLHAGLPVTSGEKWLVSQWIHDQPFLAAI